MSYSVEEIKARLNDVFIEVFDDPKIKIHEAMIAKDVDEWDSLMHITLIIAIEKKFGVLLNAAEVGKFENVGEMIAMLVVRATK